MLFAIKRFGALRFTLIVIIFGAIALAMSPLALSQDAVPSSVPAASRQRVYVMRAVVTGYDTCGKCCGKYAGGKKTAIGRNALVNDGAASAPELIPYRSRIYVPGLALNPVRVVDDTGIGMRRHARAHRQLQFDVRFPTHAMAASFGRRVIDVYVMPDRPNAAQLDFFEEEHRFAYDLGTFDPENPLSSFLEARNSYALALLTQ